MNKDDIYRQEQPRKDDFHKPDAPVQFQGSIPPQMKQALKEVRAEKAEKVAIESGKIPEKQPKENTPYNPQARVTGSSKLEELIDRLQPTSYVYEEIKLPSLGVFYDDADGPVEGILSIRPMTGEEEQILATPRWVRKGQAINMIFRRCIKEPFNTENFLSADRTYVLIWLRGISYGTEYEVELKCPECDRKFSHTINLNLDVNYCPSTFKPPLEGVLPKSGFKFSYRLPRGKDETAIQEYRDKQIRMFGDTGADDSLIFRSAQLLDNIEGVRDKTELTHLLKKMNIQDVSHIRNLTTDPPFGVNTRVEVNCLGCFHEFEVELPLEANFFFPRQKKKKEETQV